MRTPTYSVIPVLALVVLATLFGVRGAVSRQGGAARTESVTTVGGTLTLTHSGLTGSDLTREMYTVRLAGKTIKTFRYMSAVRIYSFNAREEMGDTALISVSDGSNTCPAMFYVIHIKSKDRYYITKEFGDCSDDPTVTARANRLEIWFPGFNPTFETGFPDAKEALPKSYVYRDAGKIAEMRPVKK